MKSRQDKVVKEQLKDIKEVCTRLSANELAYIEACLNLCHYDGWLECAEELSQ